MFNIFQQPWTLLAIAAIAFLVVMIFRPKREMLIPLAIALLAFGLDYLVKTDYEKIKAAIIDGTEAVKAKQIEPIDQIVDDDYYDELNGDKRAILAYCEAIFQVAPIERVIRRELEITIEDKKAEVLWRGWIFFGTDGDLQDIAEQTLQVKMRLHFRKDSDKQWRMYTSEMLEINNNPTSWRQIKSL